MNTQAGLLAQQQPSRKMVPVIEADAGFTAAECARIIADGLALPLAKGGVTAPERVHAPRDSTMALFPNAPEHGWMIERVAKLIGEVNRRTWQFAIAGLERPQFSAYAPGQYYDWHMDLGSESTLAQRKISVSVLLNDPADYDGGDLELQIGGERWCASRRLGVATIFPSFLLHRVQPVTRGTRYSLVAWIVGNTPFT